MPEQNPNPVVVAVGPDPMDAALAFAAREATQSGCGIHVVHVVHGISQGPETVLVNHLDFERAGRAAVNAALERIRDLVSEEMTVTTELVWGGLVTSIVKAGAASHLIVLERRALSRTMRMVTRSVSSGVAAHCSVPVVSVPNGWFPVVSTGAVPTVTVGVDVPERSEQTLRTAMRAARARGAQVRVLHTWAFPEAYDDIMLSSIEDEEWAVRARAEIQAVLDGIDDAQGVTVSIEARHASPGEALIEAGRSSDLLVVGRHDPLVPIGSHLGPVARAVLREAACPVLLTAPRAGHAVRGGKHEKAASSR